MFLRDKHGILFPGLLICLQAKLGVERREEPYQCNLELLLLPLCLKGCSKYFFVFAFGSLGDVPALMQMQTWVCELYFFAPRRDTISHRLGQVGGREVLCTPELGLCWSLMFFMCVLPSLAIKKLQAVGFLPVPG